MNGSPKKRILIVITAGLLTLAFSLNLDAQPTKTLEANRADVIVYGGTPGGIVTHDDSPPMKRILTLVLLLAAFTVSREADASIKRPNLVFILVDDLAAFLAFAGRLSRPDRLNDVRGWRLGAIGRVLGRRFYPASPNPRISVSNP